MVTINEIIKLLEEEKEMIKKSPRLSRFNPKRRMPNMFNISKLDNLAAMATFHVYYYKRFHGEVLK